MIKIDQASKTAPYRQIYDQLAAQIHSGELLAGQKLPSIRQLASELQMSPRTVARAYKELDTAGLVKSESRLGTRVVGSHAANSKTAATAATFVSAARQAGLDLEEATAMVSALWES